MALREDNSTAKRSRRLKAGAPKKWSASRLITLLHLAWTLLLLLPTVLDIIGPERTWFGAANMYLPQWGWAIPAVVVVPVTAWKRPRMLAASLLLLLWVAIPLMGFEWHLPTQTPRVPGIKLRVMTYNVKGGRRNAAAIVSDIDKFKPDLILMQDQQGVLQGMVGAYLHNWHIEYDYQFVVASREYPISPLRTQPTDDVPDEHCCVSFHLIVKGKPITVYDVHLRSPRFGLDAIARGQIGRMVQDGRRRLEQAKRLHQYLSHENMNDLVVAGDFNSTNWALALRKQLDLGLRDSFAVAGRGYGYTYGQYTPLHTPVMRIDHILVGLKWKVLNVQVGNTVGSDHSPVIADLFLPASR